MIHRITIINRKNRVFRFDARWHPVAMNDYERVARVIEYLDRHYSEQPDLASLAKELDLSPHHFHRLFSKWTGVTPKDFLQALTVEHARQLLRKGRSALDTALDSGLSGPGRLHDLCVTLEAASPGEIKSGGTGWTIEGGFANSPFGKCLIAQSDRGICHLSFLEAETPAEAWDRLRAEWPNARFCRDDTFSHAIAGKVFITGKTTNNQQPLRAFVKGTSFQVTVWRALLRVPSGHLVSYGDLAEEVGSPSASRAVGSAVGQNSLAFLIPCHRVIRSTGIIGDYRWGTVRKQAMVAWESAVSPSAKKAA